MVGTTAQLVALVCHFNGRVAGLTTEPFFPLNSTCKFCEYIRFQRRRFSLFKPTKSWKTVASTPDEWLTQEAGPEKSAIIIHHRVDDPRFSDRMTAGFVGGGGRWLLAITKEGKSDIWESGWKVGDQQAADHRIWRVGYGLIAKGVEIGRPSWRSLDMLQPLLRKSLSDALAFAEEHKLDGFADCFKKGLDCLSSPNPFESTFHKDLVPEGLLGLEAKQMLAACQAAWVFGGMGSWNDMSFQGDQQTRYDTLSEALFSLLNESICASTNSTSTPLRAASPKG